MASTPRLGGIRTGVTDSYHQAHGKFRGRVGVWHQLTSLLKDEVSPGFTLVGPTAGSSIGKFTPFIFTITDVDVNSPLKTFQIWISYHTVDKTELVFRTVLSEGDSFEGGYFDNSFVSPIPYGFLFSVVRNSGWIDADVSLLVTATDTLGNVMAPATVSWVVTDPAPAKQFLVIEV